MPKMDSAQQIALVELMLILTPIFVPHHARTADTEIQLPIHV